MKYLFMIYYDESKLDGLPEDERLALYREAYEYYDHLVRQGHGLAGDPLDSVSTATTVGSRPSPMVPTSRPRSNWAAIFSWRPAIWTRPWRWPPGSLPPGWAASRCGPSGI